MNKVWDVQRPRQVKKLKDRCALIHSRLVVRKFFRNLKTRGGIVGDKAVLFVYNESSPELSYILTEDL